MIFIAFANDFQTSKRVWKFLKGSESFWKGLKGSESSERVWKFWKGLKGSESTVVYGTYHTGCLLKPQIWAGRFSTTCIDKKIAVFWPKWPSNDHFYSDVFVWSKHAIHLTQIYLAYVFQNYTYYTMYMNINMDEFFNSPSNCFQHHLILPIFLFSRL